MKKDAPPRGSSELEVPEKVIRKLSDLLRATDLAEIEIGDKDLKVRVRARDYQESPVVMPVQAAASAPTLAPKKESGADGDLHIVRSPFVGTFYKASSPDADPFVQPGQSVSKGQVLCIVEAMKVMNEIECEVSGVVEKVYAENGLPVDFNAPLFGLRVT